MVLLIGIMNGIAVCGGWVGFRNSLKWWIWVLLLYIWRRAYVGLVLQYLRSNVVRIILEILFCKGYSRDYATPSTRQLLLLLVVEWLVTSHSWPFTTYVHIHTIYLLFNTYILGVYNDYYFPLEMISIIQHGKHTS